ncbi:MAG: GH3 auxin-responsive promoter family protein [Bacteroidia bacterium]
MSWYLKKRIPLIEHSFRNGADVQHQMFTELMGEARKTSFGRDFKLAEVKTIDQYRERVPLFEYDDLKPYIQRVMHGEQRVLWPGDITWFAQSSGTTSDKSKYIPVSYEALEECQFRGSRDVLAWYYYHNADAKIFQGKGLIVGGSHQVNALAENSYSGDLSAVMMNNMPFIANFLATPSMDIALLPDWENKIQKMIESTHAENVTNISGVPSWTMLLLRGILEKTKASCILEIWPNLELYVHGGVNFSPYKDQFASLVGGDIAYRETYNASEGFFGVQDNTNEDMALMLDYGIFYEFIPIELCGTDNPRTLWLDEVEIGKKYAVVLNTNAGLWRYQLGDTIEFTSRNPFRIKITGRTKSFINAFGEELMVENAEKAMTIAQQKTGAVVSEFTAAPVYLKGKKKGRHQWLIEFNTEPESLEYFADVLDQELCNANSDYESKRKGNMVLERLEMVVCKPQTFYKWLKRKQKLGGQHKIPKLCNNRKIIEEIIKINNI